MSLWSSQAKFLLLKSSAELEESVLGVSTDEEGNFTFISENHRSLFRVSKFMHIFYKALINNII